MPKHGHTAVERNRLKRQLREILRVHILRTLLPIDAVVRAQRNAYHASFETLVDELKQGLAIYERSSPEC